MDAASNPLVCVEVDNVTALNQWMSVIAIGHYEELSEISESGSALGHAPSVLTAGHASAKTKGNGPGRSSKPIRCGKSRA